MPIITVSGMPQDLDKAALFDFRLALEQAVADIPELGITTKQVTVRFPLDLLPSGMADDLTIDVSQWEKPERTPEVCERVAKKLMEECNTFFQQFYRESKFYECTISRTNESDTYTYQSKRRSRLSPVEEPTPDLIAARPGLYDAPGNGE